MVKSITFITESGTEYLLNNDGFYRNGEYMGRSWAVSPEEYDIYFKTKGKLRNELIRKITNSKKQPVYGGRILYEYKKGKVRFSSRIVSRNPQFKDLTQVITNNSDSSILNKKKEEEDFSNLLDEVLNDKKK